ncbi:hypothetical protein, partial [Polaromonas sp.]|uniref:hypothetical protein n=1 Tax=Polaromonas sp. TaxID=1869339 RepID=UPI003BB74647
LHAPEKVFHQVASLVAVRVQDALVLFAVDPAGDDDLHALILCSLDNFVRVACFASQKRLGLQFINHCFSAQKACGGHLKLFLQVAQLQRIKLSEHGLA